MSVKWYMTLYVCKLCQLWTWVTETTQYCFIRLLVVVGWGTDQRGFGEAPSAKTQLLHLVRSIRTVMRSKSWLKCTVFIVFRPHRSTTYVDAAYCYQPSSVVCRSVGRSICHTSEPCKRGWTDWDAVWVVDLDRPMNHKLDGGPDPHGRGNF